MAKKTNKKVKPIKPHGKIRICDVEHMVYKTPLDQEELWGDCTHDTSIIRVASEIKSKDKYLSTFFHECLHAVLHHSGAQKLMADCIRDDVSINEFEESLIRDIAPHLLNLMRQSYMKKLNK